MPMGIDVDGDGDSSSAPIISCHFLHPSLSVILPLGPYNLRCNLGLPRLFAVALLPCCAVALLRLRAFTLTRFYACALLRLRAVLVCVLCARCVCALCARTQTTVTNPQSSHYVYALCRPGRAVCVRCARSMLALGARYASAVRAVCPMCLRYAPCALIGLLAGLSAAHHGPSLSPPPCVHSGQRLAATHSANRQGYISARIQEQHIIYRHGASAGEVNGEANVDAAVLAAFWHGASDVQRAFLQA